MNFVDPSGLLTIPGIGWVDVGERAGQEALNYWANQAAQTSNPLAGGFYNFMGGLASLWTPCSSDATATVLSSAVGINAYGKMPAWYQYYPKGNPGYQSPWLARGTNFGAPYRTGQGATEALNLPPWNPGTSVRRMNIPSGEPIAGPRVPRARPDWNHPNEGTGYEYYRGAQFPD